MKKFLSIIAAICALASLAFVPGLKSWANASVSNTPVLVSATGLVLSGYNASNPNTGTVYVQFFDAASTGGITVGSTAPKFWIAVPINGVTDGLQTAGVAFQNGVVVAVTTTPTGGTAPSTAVPLTLWTN